jgi:4-carboxymuconolactone decarboxylase
MHDNARRGRAPPWKESHRAYGIVHMPRSMLRKEVIEKMLWRKGQLYMRNEKRVTRRFLSALLILGFSSIVRLIAQDRMPPIPPDQMTQEQKKAFASYQELRKTDPTAPPWSVLMRVPDFVVPALEMRLHNLNHSALSPKLTEFAIFIASREWTNNFEWNAHYQEGIKAGLSPAIIAAIADGRRPEHMAEDEEILYDFCTELFHNQSVSDATYARALGKFGEAGVVEAASLEGYYTWLAMVMNVARSPLPAGAKPALAPLPR